MPHTMPARREQRPVPRHLPRYADRGHEYARHVLRLRGCKLRRVRPGFHHTGHRLHAETSPAASTWAARCASALIRARSGGHANGTLLRRCHIDERHRHRYEFNNDYRETFTKAGMVISGTSPAGGLVETVEDARTTSTSACSSTRSSSPVRIRRIRYSSALSRASLNKREKNA